MDAKKTKWNFDHLFEGTVDDRGTKSMYFLEGLEELRKRAREQYATSILNGAPSEQSWANIVNLDNAAKEFCSDPRTVGTLREKARQTLGQVGEDLMDRVEDRFAELLGRKK